jgi:Sel1 repeat
MQLSRDVGVVFRPPEHCPLSGIRLRDFFRASFSFLHGPPRGTETFIFGAPCFPTWALRRRCSPTASRMGREFFPRISSGRALSHMKLIACVTSLCVLGSIASFADEATLERASQYVQNGQPERAISILSQLADKGDAVAEYKLAELYYRGIGAAQSAEKAALLYEAAAKQNIMPAQQNIAVMYLRGDGVPQDYEKAVYWFRKAAEQGDAFAQQSLGYRYKFGEGVKQDYTQALEWFKKSANQNHVPAAFEIGNLYAEGAGVQKDLFEAIIWWRKAAENGHDQAQRKLGFAYLYGHGVKRDLIESCKWLVLSQEQTGEPIANPGWVPGPGSFAVGVREQFKALMSPREIKRAEGAIQEWKASHR